MKAKIILIALLMAGCEDMTVPTQKPFIIIRKIDGNQTTFCNNDIGNCGYKYVDANGKTDLFCDPCTKYSVGDTIK